MDEFEAAEIIKVVHMEQADSLTSMRIVMTACPYCGKMDRIAIIPQAETSHSREYRDAFQLLSNDAATPALCGFCLNVVRVRDGKATAPGGPDS